MQLAVDGEDGAYRGATEPYDAIVLDLGLPRLDGLSVLRGWRVEGVNVPVLILTARGEWHEKVDGMDAGADDYLAKPFRMEELLARMPEFARVEADLPWVPSSNFRSPVRLELAVG